MKNKLLQMVLVWAMLGLNVGSANATVLTFTAPGWDLSVPGMATAAWKHTGLNAATTYADQVHFSLPVGASGAGATNTVSVKLGGGLGVITSFVLTQTDSSWNYLSTVATGVINMAGNGADISAFFASVVPGYYSLNTTFTNANSISGNIVVDMPVVPEPETYAMLLAGLALVGFTARRRKSLGV